jgi:hypothetical protein
VAYAAQLEVMTMGGPGTVAHELLQNAAHPIVVVH